MKLSGIVALVSTVIAMLYGCVALQPFPASARAGETITLAIGSLDGITRDNISISYTSDSDPESPIDIPAGNIRSVFKIYPDPSSPASLTTTGTPDIPFPMNLIPSFGGHGPWQTVVAIDLPDTLPEGDGHIDIEFAPGSAVIVPSSTTSPEDVSYVLTILPAPGGGDPPGAHVFEYKPYPAQTFIGNLEMLSQARQVVVRPEPAPFYARSGDVAAAVYVLDVPVVDASGNDYTASVPDDRIRVVLDPKPENIANQTSLIWKRAGAEITVSITSPIGLTPKRLRFSVIALDSDSDSIEQFVSDSSSLVSVKYYDFDGIEVADIQPELVIQGSELAKSQ